MNRALHRAQKSYARTLAKSPWEPLEPKLLTRDQRACFEGLGNFAGAWVNNILSVQGYRREAWGGVMQLAVRRHDEVEIAGWDILQRVKNEIAGVEAVAVEVYPPQGEVVDQANMRHLWVLPDGFDLPLTIRGRWE